jgi:hypothetical protein
LDLFWEFTCNFYLFHQELKSFLNLLLQPSVDIKTVLSQLMDRLSNYAASSPEVSVPYIA